MGKFLTILFFSISLTIFGQTNKNELKEKQAEYQKIIAKMKNDILKINTIKMLYKTNPEKALKEEINLTNTTWNNNYRQIFEGMKYPLSIKKFPSDLKIINTISKLNAEFNTKILNLQDVKNAVKTKQQTKNLTN